MSGTPLATLSIAEAAHAYRTGELSPVEVTQDCLERIAESDGEVMAFATVTAELARSQARAAEQALKDDPDPRRELLGIPLGIKELIDVAGVPSTGGSDALAGRVPTHDSTVWRRLAAAGVVLLGTTRTHELAYGVATPPTRNPWDTTRMPGGSSGGSAAALAAGMCLGALGTDTGGSIRIPANLCGVVGLKPTWGLCPTDGVLPLSPTLDHVGPLARTAADAGSLLAVMADMDAGPAIAEPAGLRVGVARTSALLTQPVAAALERAIDFFVRLGSAVKDVAVPPFTDAFDCADRIIAVEAAVMNGQLLAGAADRLWPQTRRKLESAARIDGVTYYQALRHAEAVRLAYEQVLERFDMLLAPGVACQAPAFGADAVEINGEQHVLGRALCWNTAAFNLAGLPALALPVGMPDGLPVGVQIVGRAGSDTWLLSLASALIEEDDYSQPEAAA